MRYSPLRKTGLPERCALRTHEIEELVARGESPQHFRRMQTEACVSGRRCSYDRRPTEDVGASSARRSREGVSRPRSFEADLVSRLSSLANNVRNGTVMRYSPLRKTTFQSAARSERTSSTNFVS